MNFRDFVYICVVCTVINCFVTVFCSAFLNPTIMGELAERNSCSLGKRPMTMN